MDFATCYFFFFIFFFLLVSSSSSKATRNLNFAWGQNAWGGRERYVWVYDWDIKTPPPIDFFEGTITLLPVGSITKPDHPLKMMIFVLVCFLNLFFSSMAYWVTLQAILLSHVGACRCYWTGYNVDLILSPFCHWSNAVLCIFLLNEGYEMSRSLNSIAGISGKAIGLSSVSAPYSSPSPVRRSWSPIPSIL